MNDICGINNLFSRAIYANDDRTMSYPNDVGLSVHTSYQIFNSKNEIIMQKSNQKIIKRAESPVINLVGQRPTREYVVRIGQRPILMMSPIQGVGWWGDLFRSMVQRPMRCSKINPIINN